MDQGKSYVALGRRFLELLEDLRSEHDSQFYKLKFVLKNLEDEFGDKYNITTPFSAYAEQAKFFDADRYEHYRKRVLDISNEFERQFNK